MHRERCSIIFVVRDRFSTTLSALETLFKNTPESFDLILVFGGTPPKLKAQIEQNYGERAKLIFVERLLNPSESRNIGLRAAKTRLAVLMDNDVYVRRGWLKALLECEAETRAAMVVPLILQTPTEIHTAGNVLFITYNDKGEAFGCKELCCGQLAYYGNCNLKRATTDYGELHCQLVDVETALRVGAYDEKLIEATEVDSGLTWAKNGCPMWFEPASVVHFDLPVRIDHVDDIRPYMFKWDTQANIDSYDYFKTKWGIDITEGGAWQKFLVVLNRKLGFLPRLYPSRLALQGDRVYRAIRRGISSPLSLVGYLSKKFFGYYRWNRSS